MEQAANTSSPPAKSPSVGPAPADRHSDPPHSILARVARPAGAPTPLAGSGPALCRAGANADDDPVRVDLVWRDPVTGLDLRLDLEGSPALVERLIAEGFRAPGGGGDDLEAA